MYRSVFCGAVLAVCAFAQAPEGPVLNIRGLCEASADCSTAITRQKFETLVDILAPNRPSTAAVKSRIAEAYVETLALEKAARELGIDQSAEFQERMRWLQTKTLADLFRRRAEKESASISKAEIDAYYRAQLRTFEEVKLRRLLLPKSNFGSMNPQEFERKAERLAVELRERAARGEDMDQLQKEAYRALEFSGAPPSTDAGIRRRTNLPAQASEEIFSLSVGEISKVQREPFSFVIYKVESKRTLPEELVKDEIVREIAKDKLARAIKSATDKIQTELNESYFGTPSPQQ